MKWYVVHAYSNYEHQVKRSLDERIQRGGVEHLFGKILVPTEEVVEMRLGQQRKSDRKFFPGYVLVQMELTDETWHLVRDIPRVLGFIGGTRNDLHQLRTRRLKPSSTGWKTGLISQSRRFCSRRAR